MPLTYSVEPPSLFLVRATGVVSFAECRAMIAAIGSDERLQPGARMLVDTREVTRPPLRLELRALATDLGRLVKGGLFASVIVAKPGFMYGVARMFAMFAELLGYRVGVCTTMDDAFEWLANQTPPASPGESAAGDDSLEGRSDGTSLE